MNGNERDSTFRSLRQRARQHDAADVVFTAREQTLHCFSALAEDGSPLFAVDATIDWCGDPQPASWSVSLQGQTGSTLLRLLGNASPVAQSDAELHARFEAFFPGRLNAASRLWRLEPQAVELDGKPFGTAVQWLLPTAGWQGDRQYITDHMNEDHIEQMQAMCRHFFAVAPQQVALIALDSEGMHLRADGQVHYLPFARCCDGTREVAMETVRLSAEAGAGPDHGAATAG